MTRSQITDTINNFLADQIPSFEGELNNEFVWGLEDNAFYGGKILKYRNDMGYTILHLQSNYGDVEDATSRVEEVYNDLPSLLQREKEIAEYLSSDEGAWGRQDSFDNSWL